MRSILQLLILIIALAAGFYLSKIVHPAWLSADAHRSLDEIAEEIVSNSQFNRAIEDTIDQTRTIYKTYPQKLTPPQRAQLLSFIDEKEAAMRSEMKNRLKLLLVQRLSREELIEINAFYKSNAAHQLVKIFFQPEEQEIYGVPHVMINPELIKIMSNSTLPQAPVKPASK